ncbi:MAG: helix-turn-helix transcriptional regulator [Proteobacteria bacterium]|nr:helix-turn-helix transcriptional regulator [Pseudomonadota bacterium]
MATNNTTLLSTKEVAQFLGINEKMVYTLVAEKGLPATKITGKWLFPKHLVEQWIETHTINYPDSIERLPPYQGLLIITGSNDLLLDRTISLFNGQFPDHVAVFGNLGSMGGVRALKQNLCHMAASHLLQEDKEEYNFDFAASELDNTPAVINFCRREQGILIQKGNPKKIACFEDLGRKGIRIVNRPLATGTRLLFDRKLEETGIDGDKIEGYRHEVHRHLDVGLEILAGRVHAGLGIKPVASLLDLDFVPLRWERYDLLVTKERFFDKGIQLFLGILHEQPFFDIAEKLDGYDTSFSGKIVYPNGQ